MSIHVLPKKASLKRAKASERSLDRLEKDVQKGWLHASTNSRLTTNVPLVCIESS